MRFVILSIVLLTTLVGDAQQPSMLPVDPQRANFCRVSVEDDRLVRLALANAIALVRNNSFRDLTIARRLTLAIAVGPKLAKRYFSKPEVIEPMVERLVRSSSTLFKREVGLELTLARPIVYLPDSAANWIDRLYDVQAAFNRGIPRYDLGHLLEDGGSQGWAALDSVCNPEQKGRGFTTFPNGLTESSLLFVHELAHQLGARHSFDKPAAARSDVSAYEPGEGTTLMSYATARDDYFHAASVIQMSGVFKFGVYARDARSCGRSLPPPSVPPVNAPRPDWSVPKNTPFVLDVVPPANWPCVRWDEHDSAVVMGTTPPFFRSFQTCSGERVFPSMSSLLAGAPVDGDRVIDKPGDVDFIILGHASDSSASIDDLRVRVVDSAPFEVDAVHCAQQQCRAGSVVPLSWRVSGTDGPPFDVQTVSVRLSVDGGKSWTDLQRLPNNGSASVLLPPMVYGAGARLAVNAIGGIFFNLSPPFDIVP